MASKLLFSTLIYLFSFSAFAICKSSGAYTCCLATSDESPFFISDEYLQGKKQYENFRELEDDSISNKYIPRGTIVYIPQALLDVESSKDYRLPFKVLSVPNAKLEETSQKTSRRMFKEMFWGKKGRERVERGDQGFLDKRSVRRVDEFSFIVREDARAFLSPKGHLLNGMTISPIMVNGEFRVSRCCTEREDISGEGEMYCQNNHLFALKDKEGNLLENLTLEFLACSRTLENIRPIPQDDLSPIRSVVNLLSESFETSETYEEAGVESLEIILENNNWSGSRRLSKAKINLVKFPLDDQTLHGPFNTRHYTPDDPGDTDAYVKPYAGCALLRVAEKFQNLCQGSGCEVQFGNLFHSPDWNIHKSHGSGECVDIRPFRKNTDDIRQGLTYNSSHYDYEKTKTFMELAIKAGATNMIFNDPKTQEHFSNPELRESLIPNSKTGMGWNGWWEIGGRDYAGHNDHLHFCFKEENPRVRRTCREGLSE